MQNGIQMDTLSSHLCGEAASSWLALPFTVPQLGASPPVVWPGPFLFNIPVSAQMSPPGGGLSSQLYPKHHPLPIVPCLCFNQTLLPPCDIISLINLIPCFFLSPLDEIPLISPLFPITHTPPQRSFIFKFKNCRKFFY